MSSLTLIKKVELARILSEGSDQFSDADLPLLTVAESAALLGVSKRTFQGYGPDVLARVKTGRRGIRFRPRDLVAFVRARRTPPLRSNR